MARDPSSWMPGHLGITTVKADGVTVRPRLSLNFVGAKVSSNAETESIDVDALGDGERPVSATSFRSSSTVDPKGTVDTRQPSSIGTTDDTETTLDSFTLATDTAVLWTVIVSAVRDDETEAAFYVRSAGFRNSAGTVSQVGTTQDGLTLEDDAAWDCTIDNLGTEIRCRGKGVTAKNIRWTIVSERLEVIY